MAVNTAEIRTRRARGLMRALGQSGMDLLGKAQNAAPIEEGTLRASGTLAFIVNGRRFEGEGSLAAATAAAVALARTGSLRSVDVEVMFTEVYAARQHEELAWHHPRGGGPKYLERPLLENVNRYRRAVELEDARALRGGP